MSGKPAAVRLRDLSRMLKKRDTMRPELVADIEDKILQLKQSMKNTKGSRRPLTERDRSGRSRARQVSQEDLMKAELRALRQKWLKTTPPRDESERISCLVSQGRLVRLQIELARKELDQIKSDRLQRREQAKITKSQTDRAD